MPSTALAVDGSERTLSCVDETPSTGVIVGVGGGSGVSVGGEEGVSGMVAVWINGVAEVVRVGVAVAVQLLIVNRMRIDKMRFELTY